MIKKCSIFFIILFIMISLLISQERGFKIVRTQNGKTITSYMGSYAFVVGNGNYTAGWDKLPGAIIDANEITKILQKHGFNVTLLLNADRDSFLSGLRNFTYKYGQEENNQLLIYYAGHGHTVPLASGEELGLLVMVDAPLPENDPEEFDSKSVDMKNIITWALKMKSKHVLFMFDSCFSGTLLNLRERVIPKAISEAIRYPVRQFITAGSANEPVPDRSVFNQLFIDILEGRREEPIKDGYLTGEELGLFLKSTVPTFNNFQHPQYGKIRDPNLDRGDFVFVLEEASEVEKVQLPPPPPDTSGLDLTALEKTARDRIMSQWKNWQEQMQSDFKMVENIDKSLDYAPIEKKTTWQEFIINYQANDPFSSEDEKLREYASDRVSFWENYKPPKIPEVQKPVKPATKPIHMLSINSTPIGAFVILDGEEKGKTPYFQQLPEGSYKIAIMKDGFSVKEEQFELKNDIVKSYQLEELGYGHVIISSFPPSIIEIDGKRYREVPPLLEVKLYEGKHTIIFIQSELNREKKIEIELLKGERKRVHERFD